ncbi:MAG: transcriptional regulator [Gammaproteobacteria bacterium]|nr:MAG: transcriptional regulator [Gammaproteobacteria bacterium]
MPDEQEVLATLVDKRRRVARGDVLFHLGDEFRSLYAVRTGFFKSIVVGGDEQSQIGGFHLSGDILGFDGMAEGRYESEVRAMEDSEVCVIPYDGLSDLAIRFPPLQRQLHRLMSREIVRERSVMLLLGSMQADQKVAVFLLGVAERYRRLGYSGTSFILRMTREEIGSYLGLKLETVSRHLSAFDQQGLISIDKREVILKDLNALQRVAGSAIGAGSDAPANRTEWLEFVKCSDHPELN